MTTIQIEASIPYGTPLPDLLPDEGDRPGMFRRDIDVEGPAGTTVHYDGMLESRGADIAPILQFVMNVAIATPPAVVVAWLVERFRGRAREITINRRQIDLGDEGQVRRIVEEEITVRE
jgi:hypothetical protein